MGTVITNRDRGAITKQLLDRAFSDKRAALKIAENKLFDECCDAFVGEYKAAVEQLPPGFMVERITLAFPYQFGGLDIPWNERDIGGAYARRLPAHISIEDGDFENDDVSDEADDSPAVVLPKALRKKCLAHFKARTAMAAEESALKSDIEAMLYGVRSWKKLFEQWPELSELKLAAAPPEATTGKQLSVNLPELNKKLRLPPTDQEN